MEDFINVEVIVNAPKEKVWAGLTQPEMTKQYMFGCAVTTDWNPGSNIDWVAEADGNKIAYVTGKVVRYELDKELEYTVIDPFATYPQTPENHLNITYALEEVPGGTLLKVRQGDFSKVAEGEKRYDEGPSGWAKLLDVIKDVIERN